MKYRDFWMRVASLCLTAAALAAYQAQAITWQRQTEKNQQALALAEQYNEQQSEHSSDGYLDGRYAGSGTGFGGTISVEVTVSGGAISDIAVVSADGEDTAYLNKAKQILDDILTAQTAQVDTVSGATFSSSGIREAVSEALTGAVKS